MTDTQCRTKQTWKIVGPVFLSALSLLLTYHLLQPLALWLDPSWGLLASRGMGKAAFTTMAFLQLLLFLSVQSRELLKRCFATSVSFLARPAWLTTFGKYFIIFATVHVVLLSCFVALGYAEVNSVWHLMTLSRWGLLLWSLFVTFMLAWTEELIFRGTIYLYLAQYYPTMLSVFLTSLIFMICHFLSDPLAIFGANWKIALGLFLLGFLLNTVFAITGALAANMGMHAGMVYIKVIQRKLPILTFLPATQLPAWVDSDLRACLLVHFLFALTAFLFVIFNRKKLFSRP